MSHYKETTADAVYEEYQKVGAVHLIDVREPDEFAELRTPLSRNLPLSELNDPQCITKLGLPKSEPIIFSAVQASVPQGPVKSSRNTF